MSLKAEKLTPLFSSITDTEFMPLVWKFSAALREKVEGIKKAYAANDLDQVSFQAHRLRGASSFGFEEVGRLAGKLEDEILNGTHKNISQYLGALLLQAARIELGLEALKVKPRAISGNNI